MFRPYMVITRLARKEENKYRVAFRSEITVLYIYMYCMKQIRTVSIWIAFETKLVQVAKYNFFKSL